MQDSPYRTPQSEVRLQENQEFCELKIFSPKGRIGRLRYFAYSLSLTFLFLVAFFIGGGLIGAFSAITNSSFDQIGPIALLIFGVPAYIFVIVISIFFIIRRLHDMNMSGWFTFLLLVPFFGGLFALVFMLVPGSEGPNKFGPPPPPNSLSVKIISGIGLGLMVLGILAFIGSIIFVQTFDLNIH